MRNLKHNFLSSKITNLSKKGFSQSNIYQVPEVVRIPVVGNLWSRPSFNHAIHPSNRILFFFINFINFLIIFSPIIITLIILAIFTYLNYAISYPILPFWMIFKEAFE